MLPPDERSRIRDVLRSVIVDGLIDALLDYPVNDLASSLMYFEAFIQSGSVSVSANATRPRRRLISQSIDLSEVITQKAPHASAIPPGDAPQASDTEAPGAGKPAQAGMQSSASAISRRPLGSLRPAKSNPSATIVDDDDSEGSASSSTYRQLHIQPHNFPKRAKTRSDVVFNPKDLSLNKFVTSVWEQIHGGIKVEPSKLLLDQPGPSTSHEQPTLPSIPLLPSPTPPSPLSTETITPTNNHPPNPAASFTHQNLLCRRVTLVSRACRAVETIVQARWIEHFDAYAARLAASPSNNMSTTKARQAALASACRDFGWGEKELRNKMAIWRGYKEIKDAGGWAMLVFAGMGLYRLCKYRVGFDPDKNGGGGGGLKKVLGAVRERVVAAADTLHPEWRGLLAAVGVEEEGRRRRYTGHPHDWVAKADGGAVMPLRETYRNGLLDGFEHVDECIVDTEAWGLRFDPRSVIPVGGEFVCDECRQGQSDDPKVNNCYCFPGLFGCAERLPCPVQIFRTGDGRNNGLQALASFERGIGIGEFVGLITKGIEGVDVMDAVGATKYQIWQGRQGNFTRFINHSCNPNAQFQRFVWLGTQHVILVSKGIAAGAEIKVDYSPTYWRGLGKKCLCGERCCKYNGADRA